MRPLRTTALGFLLGIGTLASPGTLLAADSATNPHLQARGLLDQPVEVASSSDLKSERESLHQLSDAALTALANAGDRSAQMILAERFAFEAETLAFAPSAANAAMSDAAYWSALAARRGFPGAAPTDGAFPSFPIRAHRRR